MLVILGVTISRVPARGFAAANVDRGGYDMRVCLDKTLSIVSSRVGERFTGTVVDPGPLNLARISGRVQSITQSDFLKGATEMHLSFDRIRFSDGGAYPINAQVIRLYDVPSGEQVDAEDMIEMRGRRRPQTLKRTGIGALASGIFGVILGAGFDGAARRPRLVSAATTTTTSRKGPVLDEGVEVLLRVYPQ